MRDFRVGSVVTNYHSVHQVFPFTIRLIRYRFSISLFVCENLIYLRELGNLIFTRVLHFYFVKGQVSLFLHFRTRPLFLLISNLGRQVFTFVNSNIFFFQFLISFVTCFELRSSHILMVQLSFFI